MLKRAVSWFNSQGIIFLDLTHAAARVAGKDPAAVEISSLDQEELDNRFSKAFPPTAGPHPHRHHPGAARAGQGAAFDLQATLADSDTNDYAKRMTTAPAFSSRQEGQARLNALKRGVSSCSMEAEGVMRLQSQWIEVQTCGT